MDRRRFLVSGVGITLGELASSAHPNSTSSATPRSDFSDRNDQDEGGNDCYLGENDTQLALGNSKIEIRIDSKNGAVTGLLNKQTGIEYLGKGKPEAFRLVHSHPIQIENGGGATAGPWNAIEGTLISGSSQSMSSRHFEKTASGAKLVVAYPNLRLERRTIDVVVEYTIELKIADEETKWKIAVHNGDPGTVRELYFPLLSGLRAFDALIMPNHSGQKLRDPIDKLSDEIPILSLEYPGRASMQWFGYYSPKAGLYMASCDQALAYKKLCFGRTGCEKEVGAWIQTYPFAASGEDWESPDFSVGLHAGDWHWSADRYRAWLESWAQKPQVPKRIREMPDGLGELSVRGRKEEEDIDAAGGGPVNRYGDLVQVVREAQRRDGGSTFLLVGWYQDGGIVGLAPDYVPFPDLGGVTGLAGTLDELRQAGFAISAYVNGRLANLDSATYKKDGRAWVLVGKAPGLGVSTIEFFPLYEDWGRWEAVMCPSAKGWQDHFVDRLARIVRDFHFDGVFIDQPGSYYAELCYSKEHGHRTPATAWGPGLLEIFRRVREETKKGNPESFLWVEGMNDAYGQYLDYSMDKNPVWEPMRIHPQVETFVEMWRYTLPYYVTANDPGRYSYLPSKNWVYASYYNFVLGVRGLTRGGGRAESGIIPATMTEQEEAEHRAAVDKAERLWARGRDFFFYGRFMDDIGLEISDHRALAKVYLGVAGIAVPIWNPVPEPAAITVALDLHKLSRSSMDVAGATNLDGDKKLQCEVNGNTVRSGLKLPPHDIGVIVFRKG